MKGILLPFFFSPPAALSLSPADASYASSRARPCKSLINLSGDGETSRGFASSGGSRRRREEPRVNALADKSERSVTINADERVTSPIDRRRMDPMSSSDSRYG